MKRKILIAPSLLAADFSNLQADVLAAEEAGADLLHLDVMDGVFVPNISFGFPVIESLRKKTKLPFDVHLMIDRPERYLERFAKAGADRITFHYEACDDPGAALRTIRSLGCRSAISIKPDTPEDVLYSLLPLCDMILVMTVEPGFGGQSLIEKTLKKIRNIRAEIDRLGAPIDLEADGGINAQTAESVRDAGANILVAGSSFFRAEDRSEAIRILRGE